VTGVKRLGESLDAAELLGRETPRVRAALFHFVVRK
jgi:hypothetical protein